MARGEMKAAAESILRELPSVVGAHVREDIYGHPREVHVLIRPGPQARALARDIRDLLEERLGVPIDQRVISIAQLADDACFADAPAPANDARFAAAPAPAPAAAGVAEATSERPDSDPRLRFLGLDTQVRDARVLVRARLASGDRELVGEALEMEAGQGRVRAAAAAILRAVSEAAQLHGCFELEDASTLRAFDRSYVLVSVFASSPYLGRRPLSLVGAHPIEIDAESAAALAALKATNRVLALMLRMGSTHGTRVG